MVDQILEGLLKLPENRECADCKSKGPRWASVNLGIFVCMQCSGIHRSLGVHISKVRSATLDTWLPEQVAFIQTMGNERSNSYWEAELPPNYDRVGIENFIRAKYEEKRWVPRDGKQKSPLKAREEQPVEVKQKHADGAGQKYRNSAGHLPEVRRNAPLIKRNIQLTPAISSQASSDAKAEPHILPPVSDPPKPTSQPTSASAVAKPAKVDFATDLFNMLSMDGPNENGTEPSALDDNSWAGFQSAEATVSADTAKPVESQAQSTSGIEDLFKDSSPLPPPLSSNPKKDVKNDIMSLFEKSNMVSPFAAHQQQMAFLAQQQALLMAAAKSGVLPTMPTKTNQLTPNNIQPTATGGSLLPQKFSYLPSQIPVMGPSVAVQNEQNKINQVGNNKQVQTPVSYDYFNSSSTYAARPAGPINGTSAAVALGQSSSASPATYVSPNRSGSDYDFSSLTQGYFTKQ